MQFMIVILIVAVAVFFSIKHFAKTAKGKSGCNCSGSCESSNSNCEDLKNGAPPV